MAGQALLQGAAGASKGLEDLLLRRFREAQLVEQMRATKETEQFRGQQLTETSRLRESQQAETARAAREREQDRRENTGRQRLALRLQSLQPGNVMQPTERDYLVGEGVSPSSFDEGPEGVRYQGRTADLLARERTAAQGTQATDRNQTQRDIADLNNRTRLAVAEINAAARAASGGGGWAEPTVNMQDKESGSVVPVPRSIAADPVQAAQFIQRYRDAGLQGAATAGTRDRANAYKTTLGLVDEILGHGDKIGWEGLGGFGGGGVKRFLKTNAGIGSDDAETLRNMIDQLKAQASFQEGGKQFTGTEKAMLENFLSSVSADPGTARLRLQNFKRSAERSYKNLGFQNPGGSGGTGTPGTPGTGGTGKRYNPATGKIENY